MTSRSTASFLLYRLGVSHFDKENLGNQVNMQPNNFLAQGIQRKRVGALWPLGEV